MLGFAVWSIPWFWGIWGITVCAHCDNGIVHNVHSVCTVKLVDFDGTLSNR